MFTPPCRGEVLPAMFRSRKSLGPESQYLALARRFEVSDVAVESVPDEAGRITDHLLQDLKSGGPDVVEDLVQYLERGEVQQTADPEPVFEADCGCEGRHVIGEAARRGDIDRARPLGLPQLLGPEAGEEVTETTVMFVCPPLTGEAGPRQGLGRLVQQRVGGVRGEERMELY